MTGETGTLQPRACTNCGAAVPESAKFCRGCGTPAPLLRGGWDRSPAVQSVPAPQPLETTPAAPAPAPPEAATVAQGLLTRAKQNDRAAIETMFKQFLPLGEEIAAAEYLGVFGFWGFGKNIFCVATDRRIASLSRWGRLERSCTRMRRSEFLNSTVCTSPPSLASTFSSASSPC